MNYGHVDPIVYSCIKLNKIISIYFIEEISFTAYSLEVNMVRMTFEAALLLTFLFDSSYRHDNTWQYHSSGNVSPQHPSQKQGQ